MTKYEQQIIEKSFIGFTSEKPSGMVIPSTPSQNYEYYLHSSILRMFLFIKSIKIISFPSSWVLVSF